MRYDSEFSADLKEAIVFYLKILSLLGETKENHRQKQILPLNFSDI
jgi:hypothetical protein